MFPKSIKENGKSFDKIYINIKQVLDEARKTVLKTVNSTLVSTYWEIGRIIVEEEQKGQRRAKYGSSLLTELSKKLTNEYGRGFDESNLRYMRQLYKVFQIRDAVRHELTWTHYKFIPVWVQYPAACCGRFN